MGLTINATGVLINIVVVMLIAMQVAKHVILSTKDDQKLGRFVKTSALMSILINPMLIAVTIYNEPRTVPVLGLWTLYVLTLILDIIVSYTWYKKSDDMSPDMFTYPALLVAMGLGTILIAKMLSLIALVL